MARAVRKPRASLRVCSSQMVQGRSLTICSTRLTSTGYHIARLMEVTPYCKPSNAGLCSETPAVARRIGRLFDALDNEVSKLVVGSHDGIVADIEEFRSTMRERLEAEGWIVGYTNGTLGATDKCRVYAPGSPAGAKIRKWRESR